MKCPLHGESNCKCTSEKKARIQHDIDRLTQQFVRYGYTFQPKGSTQKDDCINRTGDYDCPKPSTFEAVSGIALIRCCENKACMIFAGKLAESAND